ncbi:peptidase M15 [Georgenia wutianyii]|uniref:Peptidase M15 n=2 Tax=Georgenia TaxID=154116 RepID=A0ABX5VMT1_9MICO|nr:D-alanyl-D-alanine carboxypeptidase family protein [Georgenia wutianyii]QDB79530.1 peptidase M15 [Georgenia wutianyii]
MAPTSRATLARRLTALVVAAVLTLAVLTLVGADRLGLGAASAGEVQSPAALEAALVGVDATFADRVSAAHEAAAAAGVPLAITSGARSVAEQQRLFDEGVAEHGSAEAASRWVLPPDRSAHVLGKAVDVGPAEGWRWLGEHGAEQGLCQVYENEPWHFEPLVEPGGTCPGLEPDASHTVGG